MIGGDNDEEKLSIDGRAVANAYPAVTTGPRLLKILIARRDEYRDRDSDLLLAACHSKAQLFGTQDGWVSRDKKTKNIATCSMSQTITKQSPSVWDSGRLLGCTFWVARDGQNLHIGLMFLES